MAATESHYPFLRWLNAKHRDEGQLKILRHFLNNIRVGQWEVARAMLRNMPSTLAADVLVGIIRNPDAIARCTCPHVPLTLLMVPGTSLHHSRRSTILLGSASLSSRHWHPMCRYARCALVPLRRT